MMEAEQKAAGGHSGGRQAWGQVFREADEGPSQRSGRSQGSVNTEVWRGAWHCDSGAFTRGGVG